MRGKSGAVHAGVPNTQSKHVGEVLGSKMVRTGEAAATTRTMVLGAARLKMVKGVRKRGQEWVVDS